MKIICWAGFPIYDLSVLHIDVIVPNTVLLQSLVLAYIWTQTYNISFRTTSTQISDALGRVENQS